MSNSIVRRALETRLFAWAAAQSQTIPIAPQNVTFTKPDNGIWLECFLIPNATFNRETTTLNHTLIGLFQINVWCRSGEGMGDVETVAQSIVDAFPVVPKIDGVSIEKTPTVGRAIQDNGWIAVPITLSYRYEFSG